MEVGTILPSILVKVWNQKSPALFTIDAMLDSRRKRHITGGILLSAALLFGGLAITVVTIQTDEEEYEDE